MAAQILEHCGSTSLFDHALVSSPFFEANSDFQSHDTPYAFTVLPHNILMLMS
jgi:hypothetical protein